MFIKKSKVRGKYYYALVEKVKKEGKWGIKFLKSYGTIRPKIINAEEIVKQRLETKHIKDTKEKNSLKIETKRLCKNDYKPIEQEKGSIWDATIRRLKEYYGDYNE